MATTRKTSTTKRAKSTSKRGKAKALPLTWRFYVVTIGIFLVSVAAFIVMAYMTAGFVAKRDADVRLNRINDIYTSLSLDDEYREVDSNVFGDKRYYENDKNRTVSSSKKFYHADTVSNTVAKLDDKIKNSGFVFIDEPYPGAKQVEYHYKSENDEYIRLSVISKPYYDAWQNAVLMTGHAPKELDTFDANAGPSVVVVKVNLDDNNE